MAAVKISAKAFADIRFDRLAADAGYRSRWEVIGRMIPVWNACAESETDTLPESLLNSLFGDEISSHLLRVGLAKSVASGLQICGYSEHLSWLGKVREAAKSNGTKGGRPNKKNTARKNKPISVTETKTDIGYENETDNNSRNNSDREIRGSDSGIQGDQRSEISTPDAKPIGDPDRDAAWSELVTAHAEIRDRFGGDPVPWPALPARNFLERWSEAVQRCGGDRFQAAAVFRHVATVRASQAIALGHARYFTPSRTLDEESFWKSAELSEAQAIAEASKSHSPLEASLAEVRRLEREARQ